MNRNINMISNRLINVKRNRLPRLFAAIKAIKLESHNLGNVVEWQKLPDEQLMVKLATYFSMQGFKEADLKKIEKEINKIIIPWKVIGISLSILLLAFIGISYIQFAKLPRVYAIGNNVPVYTDKSLNSQGISPQQLNIYGKSVGNSPEATPFSMIKKGVIDNVISVGEDNFFSWILGSDTSLYVSRSLVVQDQFTYEFYKKIFRDIKDDPIFSTLNADLRNAIFKLVQSGRFENAMVYNSLRTVTKSNGFRPLEMFSSGGKQYLFIVLKTPSGINHNVKVEVVNGIYKSADEIRYRGSIFQEPVVWLKSNTIQPVISCMDLNNKKYDSPAEPYVDFY